MKANKNTPYVVGSLVLFILLKFGFTFTETEHLHFILYPIDQFVCYFTGTYSIYQEGYYHPELNIIIDKSCAGVNLWLISFILISYLFIKYTSDNVFVKLIIYPFALISTYFFTILVNSSRIISSIIIQTHTREIFEHSQHIIHEAIGVITNLTFLILLYLITEKLLKSKQQNAQLTSS